MVKLFRLSQMIIEYLLHSKSCMTSERNELSLKLDNSRCELENAIKDLDKSKTCINDIKKDLKLAKKSLYGYEMMARMRQEQGNGLQEKFKCQFCHKAFSSLDYRKQHEERRHSGLVSPPAVMEHAKSTEPKPDSPEMLKILQLIEKLALATEEKENLKSQQTARAQKDALERLELQKDFQELRNALSREMETEIKKLKSEREELRDLVVTNTKIRNQCVERCLMLVIWKMTTRMGRVESRPRKAQQGNGKNTSIKWRKNSTS